MAFEGHLMLGPLDGEVLSLVEPLMEVRVMHQPADPVDGRSYDEHLYVREDEARSRGVWYYTHAGLVPEETEEQPYEDSQD